MLTVYHQAAGASIASPATIAVERGEQAVAVKSMSRSKLS
jgi:hypothetical protein